MQETERGPLLVQYIHPYRDQPMPHVPTTHSRNTRQMQKPQQPEALGQEVQHPRPNELLHPRASGSVQAVQKQSQKSNGLVPLDEKAIPLNQTRRHISQRQIRRGQGHKEHPQGRGAAENVGRNQDRPGTL